MSRHRARNKHRALERAATGTYGGGGYNITQPPGNYVNLPASVLQQIINNFAPQKDKSNMYSPGAPLQPIPGVTPAQGPRQFSYYPGYNLSNVDRSMGLPDIPSFQQLRSLAKLYSGITLCERAWFDLVPKMQLKISLRPDLVAQGMEESKYQKQISTYLRFFEKPDRQNDLHSWLRMSLREQTQLDAYVLFKHLTKGKGLYALEIVDGSSVKPLLDERGMVPQPPFPAYQQYPYGVPGGLFTTDQMIYYRESPAADTPYGFSRVERIILEVNQALRKKRKDLARFTEGNIPAGIMEVPESSNWTPDQIDTYEQLWNALLAGNAQQQVRIKFTQPGMKYTGFTDYTASQQMTEFDQFLLNTAVASYGLSMGDLGFTEDIHKSSGDSQQNMLYRRTIDPLAMIYAWILTSVMQTHQIGDNPPSDYFVASFGGYEESEDVNALATAYSTLTGAGILGLSNAGKIMHLPEDPGAPHIGRVFMSKDGPVFLDDMASDKMRDAAAQAKLSGFKMAANPPQQAAPQASDEQDNASQSDDESADEDELDQAMDEADKSLDSLGGSAFSKKRSLVEEQMAAVLERVEEMAVLLRSDPVRSPNGEFGNFASSSRKSSGHHHVGHHGKHGKRLPVKQRMSVRMAKLAARFAKLAAHPIGPNWTVAQAKAAGQLAQTFSQLASAIKAGGQSEKIDGMLDQAWASAKSVYGSNQKSLGAMSHALTSVDKANDKGLFRALGNADMDTEDDDEDELFDELEDILDAFEEGSMISEQSTQQEPQAAQLVPRGTSRISTGPSDYAQGQAGTLPLGDGRTSRERAAGTGDTPEQTGMMLAFLLDTETAKQFAIPGGEPVDNLHITLAYLGDMEDEITDDKLRAHTSPFKIRDTVAMIAAHASPLHGVVGGVGRFFPAESEETPVIALVDVPDLAEFRTKLVEAVEAAGYFVADNHGYTPHITLDYIDASAPMPVESVPDIPLNLHTVCLCIGNERYEFPLGQQAVAQRSLKPELDAQEIARAVADILGREYRQKLGLESYEETQGTDEYQVCQAVDRARTVYPDHHTTLRDDDDRRVEVQAGKTLGNDASMEPALRLGTDRGRTERSASLGGLALDETRPAISRGSVATANSVLIPAQEYDAKALSSEYRRWYGRAIDDVKTGSTQRGFTTTIIPAPIHSLIVDGLSRASTVDEVKQVFDRAREHERDASFFAPAV